MKNRRLVSSLIAALVISGACTLLLGRKMTHKAAVVIPQRQYVAAALPIDAGEVIKPEALKKIDWPANVTLQGGFEKTEEVVGRAAIYPIAAGQPIINQDLAAVGAGLGITTSIPDGMRALSLRSDDVVGVGGFVFPGSRVDVLVTYRAPDNPQPLTATVLQDAEVLATGHQTQPDPDGKPTTVNVVTLLLTPGNAEKVVLASTQGSIHFILRNGTDGKQVSDPPAQMSELGGAELETAPQEFHHIQLRTAAKRPKPYIVETILGDKVEQSAF